jgi:hypothetical protein
MRAPAQANDAAREEPGVGTIDAVQTDAMRSSARVLVTMAVAAGVLAGARRWSTSWWSPSWLTALGERAAERYNQVASRRP